jgi:uncharacterized protein (TIGR02246 family)
MTSDDRAIRAVIDRWLQASQRSDVATVLDLMTDDVVFLVPGQKPFGKAAFAAAHEGMKGAQLEGTSEIEEIEIVGDWAYLRNRLRVTVTSPNGAVGRRAGYSLTILRKESDGRWRVARDANLMTVEP